MRKARVPKNLKDNNINRTIIDRLKIKKLREEYGLSQQQLAELIGYAHKYSISAIETGVTKNIPGDKLLNMAYVFECKMKDLLIIGKLPDLEGVIE